MLKNYFSDLKFTFQKTSVILYYCYYHHPIPILSFHHWLSFHLFFALSLALEANIIYHSIRHRKKCGYFRRRHTSTWIDIGMLIKREKVGRKIITAKNIEIKFCRKLLPFFGGQNIYFFFIFYNNSKYFF